MTAQRARHSYSTDPDASVPGDNASAAGRIVALMSPFALSTMSASRSGEAPTVLTLIRDNLSALDATVFVAGAAKGFDFGLDWHVPALLATRPEIASCPGVNSNVPSSIVRPTSHVSARPGKADATKDQPALPRMPESCTPPARGVADAVMSVDGPSSLTFARGEKAISEAMMSVRHETFAPMGRAARPTHTVPVGAIPARLRIKGATVLAGSRAIIAMRKAAAPRTIRPIHVLTESRSGAGDA